MAKTRQQVQERRRREKRRRFLSGLKWILPVLLLVVLALCAGVIVSDQLKKKKGIDAAKTPLLDWLPWFSAEDTKEADGAAKTDSQDAERQQAHGKQTAGKNAVPDDSLIPESLGSFTEMRSMEMLLAGGIAITGVGGYTGAFVEDGTDEPVENVLALVFENRGTGLVNQMRLEVNREYSFSFTTLFPGERVVVLEEHRAAYEEGLEVTSAEVLQNSVFSAMPTVKEDLVKITEIAGTLTVENIGESVLSNGRIFYKYGKDGDYFGGITYRADVPELAPEKTVTLAPSHFLDGESSVRFITCDE